MNEGPYQAEVDDFIHEFWPHWLLRAGSVDAEDDWVYDRHHVAGWTSEQTALFRDDQARLGRAPWKNGLPPAGGQSFG